MKRATILLFLCAVSAVLVALCPCGSLVEIATAQKRHPRRVSSKSSGGSKTQPAPSGPAGKYSHFLHSSEKHKSLTCNVCHKLPTTWTAKRDFPDVADFPDHEACVRCHRQQFFTGQAFAGTGPIICTVCHLHAAPREDARFAFGKPNNTAQTLKPVDERQFRIEFPHDKHQNVIAMLRSLQPDDRALALLDPRAVPPRTGARLIAASFKRVGDDQKVNYNNCTICHVANMNPPSTPPTGWPDAFVPPAGTFKTQPNSHDACFNCHWKSRKPTSDDCAGCHKPPAPPFVPVDSPRRISLKFNHEGGKSNHFRECTTCHINITRANTLEGLGPDVPIMICATCHSGEKNRITFPTIVMIETELAQLKETGSCTYCHTSDVGKTKPPASHDAAVQ